MATKNKDVAALKEIAKWVRVFGNKLYATAHDRKERDEPPAVTSPLFIIGDLSVALAETLEEVAEEVNE